VFGKTIAKYWQLVSEIHNVYLYLLLSWIVVMLATLRISTRLAVNLLPMGVRHCSQIPLGEELSYMDAIKLNGLMFHGYHGVLPEVCLREPYC
jgi:hypothetical protein